MLVFLLLLFVIYPLVELWLLFRLSGVFGFWTTVGVVLGTGLAGAVLARWQGFQAIRRLQTQVRQGMLPADAIGDGVLILTAGLLLITPGVLSDISGLLLLIPPVRKLVLKGLQLWLTKRVHMQVSSLRGRPPSQATIVDAKVIDARVIDPQSDDSRT